jgi:hypothetical protein
MAQDEFPLTFRLEQGGLRLAYSVPNRNVDVCTVVTALEELAAGEERWWESPRSGSAWLTAPETSKP